MTVAAHCVILLWQRCRSTIMIYATRIYFYFLPTISHPASATIFLLTFGPHENNAVLQKRERSFFLGGGLPSLWCPQSRELCRGTLCVSVCVCVCVCVLERERERGLIIITIYMQSIGSIMELLLCQ